MENQENNDPGDATEDFPDEFQCCVCLDLFYKPVVLACGHISCFWCIFKAMNMWRESYCPVCRHPYNHFPSICQTLHFVLLKLYPVAYKRRERQMTEEEKKFGTFSPQFDDYISKSYSSEEFNTLGGTSLHSVSTSNTKVHLESCSTGKGEPSLKDSSEVNVSDKDHITSSPASSSDEVTINVASQEKSIFGNKLVHGSCKQVVITDLLCAVCKELLCQPVVLNCGHVYCKACIINPSNKLCKCPVCQSVHPNGFPNVCLVLKHFLEEQFSEEYVVREVSVFKEADHQFGSPSTCSTQAKQHGAPTTTDQPWWLSGQGPDVHIGVGCDYCGMCPITGKRYKCKDCVEEIGFDLCEGCYNSSSKLSGRFNQQHTSDHKFEICIDLILRRHAEHFEEDAEEVSQNPDSSGHDQLDPEAGASIPNSSNDPSENQQGTDSEA